MSWCICLYLCICVRDRGPDIDLWNFSHLDTLQLLLKDGEMHLTQEGIWLSVNFLNIPFAPHHLLHDNWLCLLVEVLKIGSKSFYIYSYNVIWHISALSFGADFSIYCVILCNPQNISLKCQHFLNHWTDTDLRRSVHCVSYIWTNKCWTHPEHDGHYKYFTTTLKFIKS